jgi:glucose/mannose-6-phosphate isomerase
MLDDLKYIHERDAQDALGIAEKQWQQLEHEFDIPELTGPYENVVFAGMGGSALAAQLGGTWPGYPIPFEISRHYDIPAYVSDKTLFIASSYSGNTEETLSALSLAEGKNARIVVIASGGKLAERAQEKGYPLALLPGGYQPRHAALYGLKALVTILDKAGLTGGKAVELSGLASFVKTATAAWRADVAVKDNQAKQLALELMGKSPVIYAGPLLFPAAYKWKISFNENAKSVAWCNQYPEFNHNEFIGWTAQPTEKPYGVVDLLSRFEHPRIQKRFEVSERLLSGKRPSPLVVDIQGQTLLEQLLWAIALGDFVSLYVALLGGLNPTPVDLIEKFKGALDE